MVRGHYEYYKENEELEPYVKVIILFSTFAAIIGLLLGITIFTAKYKDQWRSFVWFLNGDQKFSFKALILTMISGIAFGFVDNAGLWFGVEALEEYITGGPLTQAGWGNAFSNTMGAIIATIIAKLVHVLFHVRHGPLYAEVIGVLVGCIAGIYIPRAITGRD